MFQGSVASLVSSSESGAGMSSISSCQSNSNLSIPFHNKPKLELRTHRSNMILSSSKFQVLSPISDKSQEQSSEQGDSSSRTPKVSPTDHILASCCGVNSNNDDTENNNQVRSIKSKGFFLSIHIVLKWKWMKKNEQVPIPLPKAASSLSDAKKMKKNFFVPMDSWDNPIYRISDPDGQDRGQIFLVKMLTFYSYPTLL